MAFFYCYVEFKSQKELESKMLLRDTPTTCFIYILKPWQNTNVRGAKCLMECTLFWFFLSQLPAAKKGFKNGESQQMFIVWSFLFSQSFRYCKVASFNTSYLAAHAGFSDCLWRGFLILMYYDPLTKSWFPN